MITSRGKCGRGAYFFSRGLDISKARPYNTGCLLVVKHHLNQKGTVADLDDDPDLDEESEGSMTDADMPHLLEAKEEYAEDGKHPAVN